MEDKVKSLVKAMFKDVAIICEDEVKGYNKDDLISHLKMITQSYYFEKGKTINDDKLKFLINENDINFKLSFGNLYTYLLLMGIYVKYNDIKENNEYKTKYGIFKLINGEVSCSVPIPVQFIQYDGMIKI